MKRAFFSSLIALIASPIASAAGLSRPTIAAIERRVAAFMTENHVPGLSIAIVVDGTLEWSGAYGLADLENAVPATPQTLYRSASIGKTMTATAAMQLVENGQLDLHRDIREYCPAFPAKRWQITSWNLLTHTSGIRHYGGPRDQEEQFSTIHYDSVVAALAPFKDDPLQFEPGTRWQYSTFGFDVLGCVIEGAAKVPFLAYMRDHIWMPAHMTATRDDDPLAIVPHRAAKYSLVGSHLENSRAIDMSNRLPAGGYLTTAVELAHFAEALMNGTLVKPSTFEAMTTPAKLTTGQTVGYGLGWGVEPEQWHADRWVFHGGSSPGASGFIALMPRHRFAVAFLTNVDELAGREELAEDVARVILGFGSRTQPPR